MNRFSVLLCLVSVGVAQTPAPVDATDFTVGLVRLHMDSAAARQALGAPDSVRTLPNEFGGDRFFRLFYKDLRLFGVNGHIIGIDLVTVRYATKRGLRLGDSRARAIALYGNPDSFYSRDSTLIYPDPRAEAGRVAVTISAGRVISICLCQVAD